MSRLPWIAAFLVVVGLATPNSAAAYRTAADLAEIPDDQAVGWSDPPELRHFPASVPGVSTVDVERALGQARETWGQVSCSTAVIRYGGISSREVEPNDGYNTVQWIFANWSSHGFAADGAATTDVLYEQDSDGQWRIVEADVYLNAADYEWREDGGAGPDDPRDLTAVLTHELGHLLGLMHPCEPDGADGAPLCSTDEGFAETTMYPLYRGPTARVLSSDDIAGACFLYPASACAVEGCPSGMACSADGCVDGCGGRICAADEVCEEGSCVRQLGSPECMTDADCSGGSSCAFGHCTRVGAGFGDPCDSADGCASGLCTEGGYCAADCASDSDCPARTHCAGDVCMPDGGVFGEACETADECVSDLCLDDGNGRATCTRGCADDTDCPVGLVCGDVDAELVCRPPASSGCSASGRAGLSLLPTLALFLLLWWRKR